MNRFIQFAFSKKLNKIIKQEEERLIIREQLVEKRTYYDGQKKYFYQDGKIQKLDDEKKEYTTINVEKYVENKDAQEILPAVIIGGLLALCIGVLVMKQWKSPKLPDYAKQDQETEANYQKAVKEQEEYDEKKKQEELQKFRVKENEEMKNDRKSRDFK